jgi:hypothetical protein
MTEGTYWDGKRWVTRTEMMSLRRTLTGRPPQRLKQPPKEKPDGKDPDDKK